MNRAFFAQQKKRWKRLRPFAARFSRLLPWASLVWGLASGMFLARRFDSAPKVLAFAVALLLASAALGAWTTWVARLAARAQAHEDLPIASGDPSVPPLSASPSLRPAMRVLALKHREWIDWAAVTVMQIFAQYILMFSLGFLWSARAWFHFALCSTLVASTLWDPLFTRLVRSDSYRLTLRALGLALAASFLVGVLAPARVVQGPAIAAIAASIGVFPWRFVRSGLAGLSRIGVRTFLMVRSAQVLLHVDALCLIRGAALAGDDDVHHPTGDQPENHHRHEQLDEREPATDGAALRARFRF